MNATYWMLVDPEPGWTLDSGYRSDEAAWNAQDALEKLGWETKVVQKATIENPLPKESPEYRRDQDFRSTRWCLFCRRPQ